MFGRQFSNGEKKIDAFNWKVKIKQNPTKLHTFIFLSNHGGFFFFLFLFYSVFLCCLFACFGGLVGYSLWSWWKQWLAEARCHTKAQYYWFGSIPVPGLQNPAIFAKLPHSLTSLQSHLWNGNMWRCYPVRCREDMGSGHFGIHPVPVKQWRVSVNNALPSCPQRCALPFLSWHGLWDTRIHSSLESNLLRARSQKLCVKTCWSFLFGV